MFSVVVTALGELLAAFSLIVQSMKVAVFSPMVKVMEELVKLVPVFPTCLLRDNLKVGVPKGGTETPEHRGDGQVVLVMAVEARGVENNYGNSNTCTNNVNVGEFLINEYKIFFLIY